MSPTEVLDKAGPTASTTGTTSPPATDNKKLRLSCDNCHAAKVKCTKERPLCSRCANSNAPCIYSKSRRAGKPKGCGKKLGPFNKINTTTTIATTPDFSSRADSPISDARMSMDFDDASWTIELPGSRRGSLLDQTFTTSATMHALERTDTLDPTLTQTFTHSTMDTDDFAASTFSTNMFSTSDFKMSPEWMSGGPVSMDSTHSLFTTDGMNASANVRLYQEFSSDTSTLNDDVSISGFTTTTTTNPGKSTITATGQDCNCTSSLQDILSTLNASPPSFDKFLALNKSAVQSMTSTLSCPCCVPDISAVMLLSVIITRIVSCYKKIRAEAESPSPPSSGTSPSQNVGVTFGSLTMDSEDEYQIKMVLIRSELRKLKALVTKFGDRFERFLDGPDRQLYEANVAFLECGLEEGIKGL